MTSTYDFGADPFGFRSGPDSGPPLAMASDRAMSLLLKVARAWESGDDDKAAEILARACAMPFDQRDRMWPSGQAAHLVLFLLLEHTFETGESRDWFAAVEATYATVTEPQRRDLSDALAALIQDWQVEERLARQLRTLVVDRPEEERWFDAGLDRATVAAGTESALRTAVRLSEELAGRDLCSHLAPEHW